jgi:hypothetical protein
MEKPKEEYTGIKKIKDDLRINRANTAPPGF